jgi:hypothetical protein
MRSCVGTVYLGSAGILYTSRHKRKLESDLTRVNIVTCLPCLALHCELVAYQPRILLLCTLDSSVLLGPLAYRGCSKRHTSRFDIILHILKILVHSNLDG